jgi:tight adherence protein C
MSPLLLAAAWGALVATPLVLAARRVAARARVRPLRRRVEVGSEHRRTPRLPGPVRRVGRRWVGIRRERRHRDVVGRELPLVLDLLQVAVGAGCTPYRALELTARWGPPTAAAAFGSAITATHVGSSLTDALGTVATELPPLGPVTDVLLASDRLGAPAGPALTRLAREARADLRRRAEARARTLPVKLLFPLVFLVLPAFGLLTVVPALLGALAHT